MTQEELCRGCMYCEYRFSTVAVEFDKIYCKYHREKYKAYSGARDCNKFAFID